jgi:hypothetical protein
MALCTQEQGQKRRKPQEQGLMKSVHGVSLLVVSEGREELTTKETTCC